MKIHANGENLLEIDAVLEGEGAVEPTCITRKPVHKGIEKYRLSMLMQSDIQAPASWTGYWAWENGAKGHAQRLLYGERKI
jgi:hypothetical protein